MTRSKFTAESDIELARFLRTNHSAISTEELRTLGIKRDTVTRLVDHGVLVREHRGVYRSGHVARLPATVLRCGLLAVGDDAALGFATAAHHLGHIDFAPRVPQIIVPRRGTARRHKALRVRSVADLPARDVWFRDRLRCTTSERTILDLAAVTRTAPEFRLLRRAVRQATVKDRRLPMRWEDIIDKRGSFVGSRILAVILDDHLHETAVIRSDLEDAFLDLCRDAGFRLPETNAIVEGYEVDAVWRLERVIVELDTYSFHGDVRSFERDRERDADLTVAGYRTVRITKRRLEREPGKIIRQTRTLLGP